MLLLFSRLRVLTRVEYIKWIKYVKWNKRTGMYNFKKIFLYLLQSVIFYQYGSHHRPLMDVHGGCNSYPRCLENVSSSVAKVKTAYGWEHGFQYFVSFCRVRSWNRVKCLDKKEGKNFLGEYWTWCLFILNFGIVYRGYLVLRFLPVNFFFSE